MADDNTGTALVPKTDISPAQLGSQDMSFLQQAQAADVSELAAAKAALLQVPDLPSRLFARWLIGDDSAISGALSRISQELNGTAGATGASGATGAAGATGASGATAAAGVSGGTGATGALSDQDQSYLQQVAGMTGTATSQTFTSHIVDSLTTTIAAYQQEVTSGQNPALTAYAKDVLPVLQAQLKQAQTLSSALGATGASGATGATGAGASGATGATTSAGETGATAPAGATGAMGTTTTAGPTGVSGADGGTGTAAALATPSPTGATGSAGVAGATGATGVTAAAGGTGATAAPGATGPGALSAQDQTFLQQAASGGLTEVAEGQLAAAKSGNAAGSEFGNWMVADHTAMNAALSSIASQSGVTLPTSPTAAETQQISSLQSLSDPNFFKTYVADAVTDHAQTFMQFATEAQSGSDPTVVQFAKDALPTLAEHLSGAMALELNQSGSAPAASGSPTYNDILAAVSSSSSASSSMATNPTPAAIVPPMPT